MWFKTEEKNEDDNQDIQTLINKAVKETLTQYQQGNLNTYSSQEKKKKRKYKSRKWVSATEVAEITGLKDVKGVRELIAKGYFGQVRKWGNNRNKVLREVVENNEWLGNTQELEENKGRPNVKYKKPKTNYLSKWITAREVSEIKGMKTSTWARDKMIKGYFGKTKGKGTQKSPLKVLREVVENTEMTRQKRQMKVKEKTKQKWISGKEIAEMKGIKKGWAMILMNRGHFGKVVGEGKPYYPKKVLREVVENTEVIGRKDYGKVRPKQETFNYEEIRKQLMEDPIFLSKVGSNVISNLRFINKLDS